MSRRALIGGGAGLAASAAINVQPSLAAAKPAVADCGLLPPERIGLQLYSVAAAVGEDGFEVVLPELAAIGFKCLEFAGYTDANDITLKDLKALVDELGLVPVGSHVSPSDAEIDKIVEDAQALGIPDVGISLILPDGPPTVAGWAAQAANFNRYGEACRKAGIGFYMHNHFEEWLPCLDDPSKRGMDVLLSETDPKLVDWECDLFWIHVGQAQSKLTPFEPLTDYIIPQRARIKHFHVKDGLTESASITDVGEGEVEFQTIFTELFKQSPNEQHKRLYLWERDNANDHPRGPMAAARSSFVNMRHALVADGCRTSRPLRATIAGAGVQGGRVRVKLKLNAPAKVTATLTQDGKRIARAKRTLKQGNRTLTLPRTRATGAAKLTVTVTDAAGTRLQLRDTVRI